MMTSTFSSSRVSSYNFKSGFREIQSKKATLIALETALKKRINEFKELCLKEGELTGQLPIDYPLQPREPIPQVRRRIVNGNTANNNTNNHIEKHAKSSVQIVDKATNFQPYYEETKPFQLSDFYKYSLKYRQNNIEHAYQPKTTRQLQEDVLKRNSQHLASCDDQIKASVKLIEKSDQKFLEATAKAIAGNPELAQKLNNILPNINGKRS